MEWCFPRKESVLQHVQAYIRGCSLLGRLKKNARGHSSESHFTAHPTNVGQASMPIHRLLGDRVQTAKYAEFAPTA
jgi:hypothetical protein